MEEAIGQCVRTLSEDGLLRCTRGMPWGPASMLGGCVVEGMLKSDQLGTVGPLRNHPPGPRRMLLPTESACCLQ